MCDDLCAGTFGKLGSVLMKVLKFTVTPTLLLQFGFATVVFPVNSCETNGILSYSPHIKDLRGNFRLAPLHLCFKYSYLYLRESPLCNK